MPRTAEDRGKGARAFSYARAADRDIKGILEYTQTRFGPRQRDGYAELIDRAASMIASDPARRGSRARDDLVPGLRSFAIELVARRRGAAAHVFYYTLGTLDDGSEGVIILRVLHERMDPARHITDEP